MANALYPLWKTTIQQSVMDKQSMMDEEEAIVLLMMELSESSRIH